MSSTFTPEDFSRLRAFLNQFPSSSGDSTLPQSSQSTSTAVPSPAATTISSASVPSFSPSQILSQATETAQHGLPPINQLYQSRQLPQHGHPALQSGTQPPGLGFHPFLGNLPSTSLVNQARLASASATLPRRGRRRGAAPQAPVLGRATRDFFAPCYTDSTKMIVRTVIRVLPPVSSGSGPNSKFLMYQNLRDSVDSWLSQHHLLYRYHLPTSTSHQDLIETVITAMKSSPSQYQFPLPRDSLFAAHELLPLQPLGLIARGIPRPNGQVSLRPITMRPGAPLSNLILDKAIYAAKSCVEGNEWAIYLTFCSSPIVYIRNGFRHGCLAYWFHRRFSGDTAMQMDLDLDENSSGGEALTEPETSMAIEGLEEQPSAPGPASEPSFVQRSRFLPSELWVTPWVPLSFDESEHIALEGLAETVFGRAGEGTDAHLSVIGHGIPGLLIALEEVIAACIESDDFTQLLLPDRTFQSNDSNGRLLSFGPGVEREVIIAAFDSYTKSSPQWFSPRWDDRSSIQTSCGFWRSQSGIISENRILAMTRLGVICALMLLHGRCPEPLNPLIFHFIIHDCNFNSLHRALIREWHPDLFALIISWLATGHQDSLEPFRAHFASYHDIDISVFQDRSATWQKAHASEILYYAIFGPEPPFHPEWKAFVKGFTLKCRNGFDFLKIPMAFEGGCEAFFNLLWTSAVTGYTTIEEQLVIKQPLPLFAHGLQTAMGIDTTFRSLVISFFQGSGIPCPTLFANICDSFSSLVDLDLIDTPAFRSRAFLSAATGSPHSQSVTISMVADTDPTYCDPQHRNIMLAAGKISFRTCPKTVMMPGTHILRLARSAYPSSSGEPQTFAQAFDHWFLCEILSGIGGHSIL